MWHTGGMASFGDRLRAQLLGGSDSKKEEALHDVDQWIDSDIAQKLEGALEGAVERGEDRVTFRHPFINGYRVETSDIEALTSFQFLKSRYDDLGLEYLAMSHKALGERRAPEYPAVEIVIRIPPAYRSMA